MNTYKAGEWFNAELSEKFRIEGLGVDLHLEIEKWSRDNHQLVFCASGLYSSHCSMVKQPPSSVEYMTFPLQTMGGEKSDLIVPDSPSSVFKSRKVCVGTDFLERAKLAIKNAGFLYERETLQEAMDRALRCNIEDMNQQQEELDDAKSKVEQIHRSIEFITKDIRAIEERLENLNKRMSQEI